MPKPRSSLLAAAARPTPARIALLLFLTLGSVYLLTTGGHVYSIDEETMVATTHALVHGQRDVLVNDSNRGSVFVERFRGHHTVGVYALGNSIIGIPGYLIGRAVQGVVGGGPPDVVVRLFVVMTNSLVTAATVAVLFLLCLQLGASRTGSAIVALAYGLSTFAWVEAKTFLSEPGGALLLTVAVLLMIRAFDNGRDDLLLWAGFAMGATSVFRVASVIFFPVAFAYVVLRRRRDGRHAVVVSVLRFGVGIATMLAIVGLQNWWRYGSPTNLGYPKLAYDTPWAEGVFGLLLSPGRGLFWYAPVVVAAVAVPFVVRVRRADQALVLGFVLITFLLYGSYHAWGGGATWGPRFLLPTLPPLCALLALTVDQLRWRRWVVGLATVGMVLVATTGVAQYFNAVTNHNLAKLRADAGVRGVDTTKQVGRETVWVPRDTWLLLSMHDLPDAVRNTVDHPFTRDPSAPRVVAAPRRFVHWYDVPKRLDLWWTWWASLDAPLVLLVLVPVIAAVGIVAFATLVVALRRAGPGVVRAEAVRALSGSSRSR